MGGGTPELPSTLEGLSRVLSGEDRYAHAHVSRAETRRRTRLRVESPSGIVPAPVPQRCEAARPVAAKRDAVRNLHRSGFDTDHDGQCLGVWCNRRHAYELCTLQLRAIALDRGSPAYEF